MAKDTIFDPRERVKTRYDSYDFCSYKPQINLLTHAELLPNTIVEKGDEYFCFNKWYLAEHWKIGTPAGVNFIYRRSLVSEKEYIPSIDIDHYVKLPDDAILQKGDEFFHRGMWTLTGYFGATVGSMKKKASPFFCNQLVYRRKKT